MIQLSFCHHVLRAIRFEFLPRTGVAVRRIECSLSIQIAELSYQRSALSVFRFVLRQFQRLAALSECKGKSARRGEQHGVFPLFRRTVAPEVLLEGPTLEEIIVRDLEHVGVV